jgi:hypothetical protein
MAISYQSFANTPCSIIRAFISTGADGTERFLRVGMPGTPLNTGWVPGAGNADNPVFFQKLLAAAMRLTGVANASELSGVELSVDFFLVMTGNTIALEALQNNWPNGQLLELPLLEAVTPISRSESGVQANLRNVIFETVSGGGAPTYADLEFAVPNTANQYSVVVKLFHTLTT